MAKATTRPTEAPVEQHERIVDAIEGANRDAAELALKAHLRRIFAFLGPAFDAHPLRRTSGIFRQGRARDCRSGLVR
ncbi:hypothetical protein [Mesorhizobium sp.]|uniref:hypothetical protein n=1 Tax=Mesorhizobium sp. TaxID=1871066 RepID=UPI00345DDB53